MRKVAMVKWALAGLLLVGIHFALAALSPRFAYGGDPLARPTLILVGLLVFAGAVYLLVFRRLVADHNSRILLIWVVLVGVVIRVSMLPSTPMLEDDYYRYLWDGGVTANGLNPYAYAPADAQEEDDRVPAVVRRLARDSGDVIDRINHPRLRSIYPPVAQVVFALAHRLGAWNLAEWRCVLFGFDLVTLAILLVILRELKIPLVWCMVYWWNPLLVKEVFNSGHMDVVALPFALGALLLAIRGRHLWAVGFLALGAAVKIWPVALLPLILRPFAARPRRMVAALLLFIGLVGALFLPVYNAGLNPASGFVAYGAGWEMNDALFMLLLWTAKALLRVFGGDPSYGQAVARGVVMVLLTVWIFRSAFRPIDNPMDLCRRCVSILAAVFLLGPAQFPWYYIWLLPFLTISRRPSLLLLTALLPLYYLRFYLDARDGAAVFDYGIVWVEYVPVWILLLREWRAGRAQVTPEALAG